MYSSSRNPSLTNLQSYRIWMTSKIKINFRFRRYWWFCLINFWNFFSIYVFVSESICYIPTKLPCLSDLENSGQLLVQEVLMILSYTFLKFFQYLCFRSQLPVQEALEGTDDCILWIFKISLVFIFSKSRNQFLIVFLSYRVRVISKIQVNFRYKRYTKVLMIVSHEFLEFLQYFCFQSQGIHFWHSYWATLFEWPEKCRSTSGSRGTYWWFSFQMFEISLLFMFPRSKNLLLIYSYWDTLFGRPQNLDQCLVLEVFEITQTR